MSLPLTHTPSRLAPAAVTAPLHRQPGGAAWRAGMAAREAADTLPCASTCTRLRRPGDALISTACQPVRMTIDPRDGRRALISGRMSEVCDALDRLIQQQGMALA
jgi:hypothetical protein